MNLVQRVKNLWNLSGTVIQREKNIFERIEDSNTPQLRKFPEPAKVIPYKHRDPVKEIIGETKETV